MTPIPLGKPSWPVIITPLDNMPLARTISARIDILVVLVTVANDDINITIHLTEAHLDVLLNKIMSVKNYAMVAMPKHLRWYQRSPDSRR